MRIADVDTLTSIDYMYIYKGREGEKNGDTLTIYSAGKVHIGNTIDEKKKRKKKKRTKERKEKKKQRKTGQF